MTARTPRLLWELKSRLAQGPVRAASRAMIEAERLDPELLRQRSIERGMALAQHAAETVPFYRELYAAVGIGPAELRDPEVFDHLPTVDKATLREAGDAVLDPARPASDRLPSATGGSTGQPLLVRHDRRAPTAAMWWRVYGWWGVHPADDHAFVQRDRRSAAARRRERLEWWPSRRTVLDATRMTPAAMDAFLDELAERRTALLNGYVGGVHELARHAAERGRRIPGLRAVGITAAPATAAQRAEIEAALGAPVHDQYRSAEVPWMAAECAEREGLHVLADHRILEILAADGRPAAPDETGEVVVTDLANGVQPIIRYRLGDRSALLDGVCACGRTLPRIRAVEGRVSDVLRLPDGQRIAGGLTGLFNARPDAVSQFQIVQSADRSVRIDWRPGAAADAEAVVEEAVAELRRIVGGQVPVTARRAEQPIAHDGGKSRVIRSEVVDV
ncbi:phenylacetate--CoA ligase family protein [Homoserinibacter sp. YIM 151385]|uniref:phenylacetate--CoA ligase family protein n=1 Tax=Homoserinibacter sp. YIM 151385 TaxID=2985506 RepID=UPI0022F02C36|nr:hypothetical protein [Homoserinibacter sp. YIM 151385]WBU38836.1 hypothetical protein OF852_04435 [Homoserinibacter sp. YIM 151385]